MVDKIKTSSGSQGVDKCNGCQKTVLLGELFRCTTCKENSAGAADAEIRVCSMCIVTSHSGHDYLKLDVASKADFDVVREKIDGYKRANEVERKELQQKKRKVLMIDERAVSLTTLEDDVDGSNALTKAQLAAKLQQAEQMTENIHYRIHIPTVRRAHTVETLQAVWHSLPVDSRQLLRKLAEMICEGTRPVMFRTFLRVARNVFKTQSEVTLRKQIREFEDHHIINHANDEIKLEVKQDVIISFLDAADDHTTD